MSKEMYASILLQHVYTFDPDERERIALISATFIGIVDSIVNQADYTTAQKIAKLRNLNDYLRQVSVRVGGVIFGWRAENGSRLKREQRVKRRVDIRRIVRQAGLARKWRKILRLIRRWDRS